MNIVGYKNIMGREIAYVLEEMTDTDGSYSSSEGVIRLNPKNHETKEQLLNSLIHEEFHCVCDRLGVFQGGLGPELEEIICNGLANFITENYHLKEKL